jgi:hypothetical protein
VLLLEQKRDPCSRLDFIAGPGPLIDHGVVSGHVALHGLVDDSGFEEDALSRLKIGPSDVRHGHSVPGPTATRGEQRDGYEERCASHRSQRPPIAARV